ncbi:MAG: metalloregulator ArsR/SmtB family transcription factor [Eubacteriales bacterium]|nr:metalloregulator ArsR/SmtB family transcription factor [Eubacteriales bacterium]
MNETYDGFKSLELAEFFKYFSDPTRVRILSILCSGERCVCDIAGELGMNQSAISHQLNLLRKSRLVRTRRDGKSVYYSLDDDHVKDILSCGISHLTE